MSQMNHAGFTPAISPLVLDWQPDIERLRAQAKAAHDSRIADPYAAIEAECWLDLIEAEIEARTNRAAALDPTLAKLRRWRSELTAILGSLEAVAANRAMTGGSEPRRTAADCGGGCSSG